QRAYEPDLRLLTYRRRLCNPLEIGAHGWDVGVVVASPLIACKGGAMSYARQMLDSYQGTLNVDAALLAAPGSNHSVTMARRTLSFAARRLGKMAAATPARPARMITMSSVLYGTLNTDSPLFFWARTSAQPTNTPTVRPRTVPCRATITDSQRIVPRSCRRVMPTARITPSSRVRSKIDRASVLP